MTNMLSKTSKKRWALYLGFTAFAGFLGSAGPLIAELAGISLSATQTFSVHMAFVFLFLGLMSSLLIDIWYEEKKEERLPVEVFQGQRDIMKVCKSIREGDGACEMKAVWCSEYPDVDRYFKEEMDDLNNNTRLIVKRLINKDIVTRGGRVPAHYRKHLSATQPLRNAGQYEVKTTDLCEMECTVCKYVAGENITWKAFLIINNMQNHIPVLGILFDPAKKPECESSLLAIAAWFDKEWDQGGKHL
jgi:hypothetical protein